MAYYFSPFRKIYNAQALGGAQGAVCPFCDPTISKQCVRGTDGRMVENDHYVWMVNFYPKFEGHTMLVPKRHLVDLEDETPEEILARHELLCDAKRILIELYPKAGFEIFLQTGEGSESTVKHLHWHILPAQVDDPLRSFAKMGHFVTTQESQEKILIFPVKIEHAREELLSALAPLVDRIRKKDRSS